MASAALAVLQMEQYLDKTLPDKNDHRRWENTYIQRQIEKRQNGCSFSISDHIRGMVYAMLSSGISWVRVEQYINPETRQLTKIDEIFWITIPDICSRPIHLTCTRKCWS